MARRKDARDGRPPPDRPPGRIPGKAPRKASDGAAQAKPSGAFDLWLDRGLHEMYDSVAREPVPDELLRLIEEDRKK